MTPPSDLSGVRLPAAFVDLDAFDRNLDKLIALSNGKKIRLATKSIRVPELIRRALKRTSQCQGLMCYSAEEVAFLSKEGFDDFLVAYPTVQPSDLSLLRSLHERGKRVVLIVDSEEQLKLVSAAMDGTAAPFRCAVEVDASLRILGMHIGVRRSPIRSAPQLKAFLLAGKKHSGVKIVGAMVYEAQLAGLGDRNPFKKFLNPIFSWIRKTSVRSVRKLRAEIPFAFSGTGATLEIFNGGGTGSINFAASEEALTEVTAGSALLCSHLFDYYSNVSFEPSAFFALQVVRSSDDRYVTCQGGGYIASGEPGWDRVPVPVFPAGSKLVSTEGCGEVQTPVQLASGVQLRAGDAVWFRHAKAGELAERFNEYHLISNRKIIGSAKTYRGFGQCYF